MPVLTFLGDTNPIEKTITLTTWTNDMCIISDGLITPTSYQIILPSTTMTSEQYDAFCKAKIIDAGQTNGSLTLKALGGAPEINIPIRILFRAL